MNYNDFFCKNIASIIVHCIIEKLYTETPDRPNIKSCKILNLFNNKILGDRKLKIRVTFFIELGRKYLTGSHFTHLYCVLFNKC